MVQLCVGLIALALAVLGLWDGGAFTRIDITSRCNVC